MTDSTIPGVAVDMAPSSARGITLRRDGGDRLIEMEGSLYRSRSAVIRPEDTTEALPALDVPGRFGLGVTVDQSVAEALVIALQVIMSRVFLDGVPKVPFADGDDLGEALFLD